MNPPYRDNRLLVIYTVLTIHGLHYIFFARLMIEYVTTLTDKEQ